jgi:hypothetical protein
LYIEFILLPNVLIFLRIVNENADLLGPNLLGAIPEDEEHGVNDVALAAAVRADDRRKTFVERTQNLKCKVNV